MMDKTATKKGMLRELLGRDCPYLQKTTREKKGLGGDGSTEREKI